MGDEKWERQELWDGWSLDLPPGFTTQRNQDGSWSAWDQTRLVEVVTLSTVGIADGGAMTSRQMLGPEADAPHEYAIAPTKTEGYADLLRERDEGGELLRLTSCVAVANNLISCHLGFRDEADLDWALHVWRSIEFREPHGPAKTL
jgi:hypothetical protein